MRVLNFSILNLNDKLLAFLFMLSRMQSVGRAVSRLMIVENNNDDRAKGDTDSVLFF